MLYRTIQLKRSEEARKAAEALVQQSTDVPEQPEEIPAEEPKGWQEAPVYNDPDYDAMREINLETLREGSRKCARELLDYRILAARLYR
jgi:hypothetical protein